VSGPGFARTRSTAALGESYMDNKKTYCAFSFHVDLSYKKPLIFYAFDSDKHFNFSFLSNFSVTEKIENIITDSRLSFVIFLKVCFIYKKKQH
jgi:hypothetical protein